jgi:hypothetical protein
MQDAPNKSAATHCNAAAHTRASNAALRRQSHAAPMRLAPTTSTLREAAKRPPHCKSLTCSRVACRFALCAAPPVYSALCLLIRVSAKPLRLLALPMAAAAPPAPAPQPSWGSARSVDEFEKLEQIGEGTYGQARVRLRSYPCARHVSLTCYSLCGAGVHGQEHSHRRDSSAQESPHGAPSAPLAQRRDAAAA